MFFRCMLPFAAVAAFALSTAAMAQDGPASSAPPPAPPSYSGSQMESFARATVEMQALGSPDPAAQTRVIERSGMTVEDYNRMGDDMRASPALAAGLTPYLDQADTERRARVYRSSDDTPARSYAPAKPRHTASAKRSSSRHARAERHARAKHGHAKASSSHRSAKASAGRKATHKASSARSSAHAKATKRTSAPHASKRHKRKNT